MSAEEIRTEQRSSVKITENSKGEPAVEVKVYDGTGADELELTRQQAVKAYQATVRDVRATP